MEEYSRIVSAISVTLGAAWGSGINLYATIAVLGLMGRFEYVTLPGSLDIVMHPLVITAACLMYVVEFVADKIPGVDTGWDTIHTFIRIPAGAALTAAAVWDVNPAVALAAGILGGTVTAGTHTAKAGSRVMINMSPEPVTNWVASTAEDAAVITGVWAALFHPTVFLVGFLLFVLLLIWILPKVWRGIRRFFSGKKASAAH